MTAWVSRGLRAHLVNYLFFNRTPSDSLANPILHVNVDRRYLYTGSANFTGQSVKNEELCFRMTGPVVAKVLEKLAVWRTKGEAWTGRVKRAR